MPQPLFDQGITALGGTWIEDGLGFIVAPRQGLSWSRIARKALWLRCAAFPRTDRAG